MDRLVVLLLLACALQIRSEVVKFTSCDSSHPLNCTVSQVRISPCPEANKEKPCSIKRGNSASIEFDFVGAPNVDGLETRAYWASGGGDLPWIGMDTKGCAHTQCPTGADQQTFKYELAIGKKYPARDFKIKWKLWKEDEMECCFLTNIKLTK